MVSKYKKKRPLQYTLENLSNAIEAVKRGIFGMREASRAFGVPVSTLHRHIKYRKNNLYKPPGHPTTFSQDDENELARRILDLYSEKGSGLTNMEIRTIAFQFATVKQINHPFSQKTQQAGKQWVAAFFQRHPEVMSVRAKVYKNSPRPDLVKDSEFLLSFDSRDQCFEGNGEHEMHVLQNISDSLVTEMSNGYRNNRLSPIFPVRPSNCGDPEFLLPTEYESEASDDEDSKTVVMDNCIQTSTLTNIPVKYEKHGNDMLNDLSDSSSSQLSSASGISDAEEIKTVNILPQVNKIFKREMCNSKELNTPDSLVSVPVASELSKATTSLQQSQDLTLPSDGKVHSNEIISTFLPYQLPSESKKQARNNTNKERNATHKRTKPEARKENLPTNKMLCSRKCANENVCGFCGLDYSHPRSAKKGDWTRCAKCKTWYHERCVGSKRKKRFVCGRCM